jgi:hypothetical protein
MSADWGSATGRRKIPEAVIGITAIGGARGAADHVSSRRYRVRGLDVDLLSDLDRIADSDAEVPHSAFDLGMPQHKLDSAQITGAPVDQHGLRAA